MQMQNNSKRLLDNDDGVWVLNVTPERVATWTEYASVKACALAAGITADEHGAYDITPVGIVVIYYDSIQNSERTEAQIAIWGALHEDVHGGLSDYTGTYYLSIRTEWNYVLYGHVHFIDYPEIIDQSGAHPNVDFVSLMNAAGFLGPSITRQLPEIPDVKTLVSVQPVNPADFPIFVNIIAKFQEIVDRGRRAMGLDIFSGPPQTWVSGEALSGGDWVQYGSRKYDQWIAKIDIPAASNTVAPNVSAAFRSDARAPFEPEWDDDDFEKEMVVDTDLFISYSTNVILLKVIPYIFDCVPRFGYVSLKSNGKWLIAKITHRMYNDTEQTMLLSTDPHEKKGTIGSGSTVSVRLTQLIPTHLQ